MGSSQSIGGEFSNQTDISTSAARDAIRRNVATLTRGMHPDSIVNGVWYMTGDIHLSSGSANSGTLVVKGANVFIDGDLTNSTTFGLIVLKNDPSSSTQGNIYVATGVTIINAFMYADGTIYNHNPPITDDPDSAGTTPLKIFGSLFTRNTIGGSI
jgi:hypothetical protein